MMRPLAMMRPPAMSGIRAREQRGNILPELVAGVGTGICSGIALAAVAHAAGKWGGGQDVFMTVEASVCAAISSVCLAGTFHVGAGRRESYDFATPRYQLGLGAVSLLSGAAALFMGAAVLL